jgi:hypothetical protein
LADSLGHANQGDNKSVGDAARKKIGSGLTNSFGHANEVFTKLVGDACAARVSHPMTTLHSWIDSLGQCIRKGSNQLVKAYFYLLEQRLDSLVGYKYSSTRLFA